MDDIQVDYCTARGRNPSEYSGYLSDDPPESHSGGWYNTRCLYRSVAFGTWQVGGARQVLTMRLPTPGKQLFQTRSLIENRAYCIMNDGDAFGFGAIPPEHQAAALLHEQLSPMSQSMIDGACLLEPEAAFLSEHESDQNLEGISRNGSAAKPSQRAMEPLINDQRKLENNKNDNNNISNNNNKINIDNNNIKNTVENIDNTGDIPLTRRRNGRRLEWSSNAKNRFSTNKFDHINTNNISGNINNNQYNNTSSYNKCININTTDSINKSMQRLHHRSRSAGCDALFSIISNHPSTSCGDNSTSGCLSIRSNILDMSGSSSSSAHSSNGPYSAREPPTESAITQNHICLAKKFSLNCTRDMHYSGSMPQNALTKIPASGTGLSAFKATKRFLKRIYHSATLPGRSHGTKTGAAIAAQSSSADPVGQLEAECPTDRASSLVPSGIIGESGPFFEIRHSSDFEDEEEELDDDVDPIDTDLIGAEFTQLSRCSLGHFPLTEDVSMDHDSTNPSTMKSTTIDDQMNDSLLTRSISSNDSSQKTSSGEFHSWAEVFEHLKRELKCMRERDAQILADLQQVETQLKNVKNQSLGLDDHFSVSLVSVPSEVATSKSDYSILALNGGKMGPSVGSSIPPL